MKLYDDNSMGFKIMPKFFYTNKLDMNNIEKAIGLNASQALFLLVQLCHVAESTTWNDFGP